MIFHPTPLAGAYVIEMQKIEDERGSFARAFCRKEFARAGLTDDLAQANIAMSRHKGTLRGMHFQAAPFQEAKLIRCIKGAIYDVMIDLRRESPTFGKWYGRTLTEAGGEMLYVPQEFAHGYLTLHDQTEIFYLVSQFYSPEHERGVRWDDLAFKIQ